MRAPPSEANVTVSGSAIRAPSASPAMSSSVEPAHPAQVEKGTTTLPFHFREFNSVRTAGARVAV